MEKFLYARESIEICRGAAEVSKAQAERSRQLMEAGKASRVDCAQLESQAEQDRYALVNAQGTYATRCLELKKLLELGLDTEVALADVSWSRDKILATLPPAEETYSLAMTNDPELESLALQREGSELDIKLAKAGKMPRISLNAAVGTGYNAPGGAFGTQLKQSFGETLGLTFSLPIFDNKKTRSAVARARVQQLDADLDIDSRENELSQDVENWYVDTRSAQSRYLSAEEQLKAAQLSEELSNAQFELGLCNAVELMTAHNSVTEAQFTLLQAKYMAMLGRKMIDYYREAKVTLP